MTQFDYISSRADADELIKEFGMKAVLRRSGVDRVCYVAIVEYAPRDPSTQLANPTERRGFMSSGLGDVPGEPPDDEQDQLVTFVQPPTNPPVVNEVMHFAGPVKPISPAGIVVAYEFRVRL